MSDGERNPFDGTDFPQDNFAGAMKAALLQLADDRSKWIRAETLGHPIANVQVVEQSFASGKGFLLRSTLIVYRVPIAQLPMVLDQKAAILQTSQMNFEIRFSKPKEETGGTEAGAGEGSVDEQDGAPGGNGHGVLPSQDGDVEQAGA